MTQEEYIRTTIRPEWRVEWYDYYEQRKCIRSFYSKRKAILFIQDIVMGTFFQQARSDMGELWNNKTNILVRRWHI